MTEGSCVAEEPKPPTAGVRCPKCACCDLRCWRTERLTNRIRRRKRCRYCGYSGIVSVEVLREDLPKTGER